MTRPASRTERLPGSEGELAVRIWPAETPGGVVQISHGLSQHMGMYEHVAAPLVASGWTVVGHDHVGHGASDGARGVLPRFETLVDDLARVYDALPDLTGVEGPVVGLGHSLGGLAAIRWVQTRPVKLTALALSAPWLGTATDVPWIRRMLAAVLWRVAPDHTIENHFDPTRLTRDPVMQDRRRTDPRAHSRISAGLFERSKRAQRAALADSVPPEIDTLVLLPTADEVADPAVTRRWVETSRRQGASIELLELEGVPHEPFNDSARNEILKSLVDWMGSRRAHADAAGSTHLRKDQENQTE